MSPVAAFLSMVFIAAGDDPRAPRVQITPILHTGDPAPGIPDSEMVWMARPQIDGVGNVLISGFYQIDGEAFARGGIWYGAPGQLDVIMFEGMPAPDLPPGVTIEYRESERLSENGWISFTGELAGPGIVADHNDNAIFAGPPGDIRKVLQTGDQAFGLEPGTTFLSTFLGFGAGLSDNATMIVASWLSGPAVDDTNDRGIWIGQRDDLQVVWRKGMEAPGTKGARFTWADFVVFNDNAQIAFRGGLTGDSIDETNDVGRWLGGPDQLTLVTRAGDPAPGFPEDITLAGAGGGAHHD